MSRPKFASRDKRVIIDPERAPKSRLRAQGTQPIIDDSLGVGEVAAKGLSAIFKMIFGIVAILVVLYISLAATLMSAVPGNGGFTWVARGTFVGGVADTGDFVYASATSEADPGVIGNIVETFTGVNNPVVAEVIAPPFKTITVDENSQILSDGETTGFYDEDAKMVSSTKENYLAVCVQGSCDEGTIILLPQENVSGEAKGQLSLEGVGNYDSFRK